MRTDDAVARYKAASEANDIDALMATLADDAELVSPVAARFVFHGKDDLRVLLAAVYGMLSDLRWSDPIGADDTRLLIGRTRIGPLRLDDAMVFELAPDGSIARIRPHLRPWLAATVFAMLLGPQVMRRPGIVARGVRRGWSSA